MKKQSKGALIFAHNNPEIDYVKIAAVNALMIQENLKVGVTLVTDDGTLAWAIESMGKEFVDRCFENIKVVSGDVVYRNENIRVFRDTQANHKQLPFYNSNHWMAYDLSPYDETLFVDADYLIMSDALSNCWGSVHDFMINKNVTEILEEKNTADNNLDDFGIDLYWATCIYFKKTEQARHLFSLAHYVYDNYRYFKELYLFPGTMFRNDYAFSIAVHMMNGFNKTDLIKELPILSLYKSFDHDDIVSVNGKNSITLLLEKPNARDKFVLTNVTGIDIHIMNKWAVIRHADKLIEVYS